MPPSAMMSNACSPTRSALRTATSVIGHSHLNEPSNITMSAGRHFSHLLNQSPNANDNSKTTGFIASVTLQPYPPTRYRMMSSDEKSTSSQSPTEETETSEPSESDGNNSTEEETPSETLEEKLQSKVTKLKDQLLRALAEQENIRRIARRDVDNSKSFAVASFAKSLLDTSDNLSRALEAVPEEHRSEGSGGDNPVLANLYEGREMTDNGLTKAFEKNGLVKFGEAGDIFDPNRHEALFEYVEEGKDVGTVVQVMKVGFELNSRVMWLRRREVWIKHISD